MASKKIPTHLLHQIQQGKGQTYRRAIRFKTNDFKDFVRLEYEIVSYIIEHQELDFRIIEQHLVTKGDNLFDILDVEIENSFIVRYYFDITHPFDQYKLLP